MYNKSPIQTSFYPENYQDIPLCGGSVISSR